MQGRWTNYVLSCNGWRRRKTKSCTRTAWDLWSATDSCSFFYDILMTFDNFLWLVAKIRRASVLRSNIATLCSPKSVDVETQELQGKKAAIMEKKARAQGPKDLAMRWETQGPAGNEGWHSLILVDRGWPLGGWVISGAQRRKLQKAQKPVCKWL